MALPDADRARSWAGRMIVDRDGAEIGVCTQIWTDDRTGRGEWAAARMGAASLLVPLTDAAEEGAERVRVVVLRDEVMLAPAVGDRQHLTEDDEGRLYRHFGLGDEAGAGAGAGTSAGGPRTGAEAVTDRLRLGLRGRDPVVVAALAVTALAVVATVVTAVTALRRSRKSLRANDS